MFSSALSRLDPLQALDRDVDLWLVVTSMSARSSGHDLSRKGLAGAADRSCSRADQDATVRRCLDYIILGNVLDEALSLVTIWVHVNLLHPVTLVERRGEMLCGFFNDGRHLH